MINTGLKQYKDFREGQILTERIGNTNRFKQVLCKGIYKDEQDKMYAGYQYIDAKQSRINRKVTVSGKSPFWFEEI